MKEETKKLVDWITCQLSISYDGSAFITEAAKKKYDETKIKAINFLNSLPEIESHLCRGGYIQDKNGTPCCDDDKVINESILNDEPMIGTLYWSKEDARFYFKCNDTLYSLSKNLEKVKSQSKWDKIKKVTK